MLRILLTIVFVVLCIAMVAIVLLQEGKDPGLKGISGSTPDGDSFFNRNSGRTKAAMYSKMTTALAILFVH